MSQSIVKALGSELQAVRTRLKLSRPKLVAQLQPPMPANTYACYEQGIRPCPLDRLLDICHVLKVSPVEVFRRAYERTQPERCPTCGTVPLADVASVTRR